MSNGMGTEQLVRYLGWLSRGSVPAETARQANAAREQLLASLSAAPVDYHFNQSKAALGALSPGCLSCGQGSWSCLFVSDRCTANCFFCPMEDTLGPADIEPVAEGITFDDEEAYLDYLETFDFKGVSFSGGEPLLAFDKIVSLTRRIKQRFGSRIYVWMYTNGDLVEPVKLQRLRDAGLDEIRINIRARMYSLRPVEVACQFIDRVAVEIPAVPEDFDRVRDCLRPLAELGIDYLNLHQLMATLHNHEQLGKRPYTYLPPAAFREAPVIESELMVLRLIHHTLEQGIALPINYCSHIYKARFQSTALRQRAAALGRAAYERITEAGYISRLFVQASPAKVTQLVTLLRAGQVAQERWQLAQSGDELAVHPSLLPYLEEQDVDFWLRYFQADIVPHKNGNVIKELPLNEQRRLFLERKAVGQPIPLSRTGLAAFQQHFLHNNGTETDIWDEALAACHPWESLGAGFQEIAPYERLLVSSPLDRQ